MKISAANAAYQSLDSNLESVTLSPCPVYYRIDEKNIEHSSPYLKIHFLLHFENDVLAIIQNWAFETTLSKAIAVLEQDGCGFHRDTVANVYMKLRKACKIHLNKKGIKLGGPNRVVKINDSLFARVKHHVGKPQAKASTGIEVGWLVWLAIKSTPKSSLIEKPKRYLE